MDRRIKLRHVEAFVEIARQKSLKGAGEALGLTQPAISKILKELEDILGASLMSRGRGGVELSAAGVVFLKGAEASLSALRQGFDGVTRLQKGGAGALNVGAMPSVAARVLPLASLKFRSHEPETVLKVEDGPHGFLMERLRTGALDLVVGRMGPPATMAGTSFTPLYSEQVVFVARAGHNLSGATRLEALRDQLVIYPSERAAIRPLVDRLFIAEGVGELPHRIESVSGDYGRGLTRTSEAVWIISESVVAGDIESGLLEKLPFDTGITAGPVGIMTRAEEDTSPAVQLFRTVLGEAVEALGLLV
ncbi:pca operon transcription factor PcaQ [Lentibacter sp. XHP0401]|jgi:LysR family transcriptional regulator, pca operon transcriptional activator|uniref:pca operon transcription factor PcaQ n=1 Tax=Lentibacter sp. XHP0401 TaxID=2984334 RepID=UPI0021E8A47F|nr:pca operon transcription factor PcaQ [Lentibacter sp. XHP0401]MCV2894932.1 pca operon transcription factor PcaQ [Lentibacter sp. XHP0401]